MNWIGSFKTSCDWLKQSEILGLKIAWNDDKKFGLVIQPLHKNSNVKIDDIVVIESDKVLFLRKSI